MAAGIHRSSHAFVIVLLVFLLGGVSCRSPLNADELIAATTSGRAGEISNDLQPSLTQEDKIAIARYLADLEPLAGEVLRLIVEADALQLATRGGREEVVTGYRALAARSGELAAAVKQLTPPAVLAPAHVELVVAYEAHATVAAIHAAAFAEMDFTALRDMRAEHEAAHQRVLAAHERLERDAAPLFRPDRPLKIKPQR